MINSFADALFPSVHRRRAGRAVDAGDRGRRRAGRLRDAGGARPRAIRRRTCGGCSSIGCTSVAASASAAIDLVVEQCREWGDRSLARLVGAGEGQPRADVPRPRIRPHRRRSTTARSKPASPSDRPAAPGPGSVDRCASIASRTRRAASTKRGNCAARRAGCRSPRSRTSRRARCAPGDGLITITLLPSATASSTPWVMSTTRATGVLPDPAELGLQMLPREGIECTERLVHQHQVRIVGEHAGDLASLLHATGQFVDGTVGELRQSDPVEFARAPARGAADRGTPRMRSPSSTFLRTDSHGISDVGCWNTTPRSAPGPVDRSTADLDRVRRSVRRNRRSAAAASSCRNRSDRRGTGTCPAATSMSMSSSTAQRPVGGRVLVGDADESAASARRRRCVEAAGTADRQFVSEVPGQLTAATLAAKESSTPADVHRSSSCTVSMVPWSLLNWAAAKRFVASPPPR